MREGKRECERRRETEKYLYMCVRIWSYVWHVWREDGEIEAGKEKEPLDNWSSTVRRSTPRYRREKESRVAGKTRTTIKNGRYHKCHYPSNPSATESMRNKECRTMNLDQILLDRKLDYSDLPSLPRYVTFIYIRLRIIYILPNRSQHARSIPMLISYLSSNGFPLTREALLKRASTFHI